jgi:AraC-like DNA-binding protein/mannose-6-phosphate isomerase-like protein (cupin superfamily)
MSTMSMDERIERAWASGDPYGEALHFLRLEGVVYAHSQLSAPWGIAMPAMDNCVMFHIVTSGVCWVRVKGEELIELRPGAFALVPHGMGHDLMSGRRVKTEPFFDLPVEQVSERYERLVYGGGGEETQLICGAVCFDHPAAVDLVRQLPRVIHVDAWNAPESEWMQSTLRLMAIESKHRRAGGETIVTRLADILVIQGIRSWLARGEGMQQGWLAALRDERIGRAIVAMQREPGASWTVESLARNVSMSRSAFALRFQDLVGESPMEYLTRWRMQSAAQALRTTNEQVIDIAERYGYGSEAAFSRAFKRVMGETPGKHRRGKG